MMRFVDPLFDSQNLVFHFVVVLRALLLRTDSGPWSLHASATTPYELFSVRCPSSGPSWCLPSSCPFK